MKLFKDAGNNIYAYEADGSQDHLIGNKTSITAEQANQLKATKVAADFAALPYSIKRRAEYPPFADFTDAWVKNDQTALDAYRSKCLAIKAKYPKS
jgi:hypothetical protein